VTAVFLGEEVSTVQLVSPELVAVDELRGLIKAWCALDSLF
jgi:hypothetical protein